MELKKVFELDSIPGESVDEIDEKVAELENIIEQAKRKKLWLQLCPHLRQFIKQMFEGPIEVWISGSYCDELDIVTKCTECKKHIPNEIEKWYRS